MPGSYYNPYAGAAPCPGYWGWILRVSAFKVTTR